MRNKIPIGAKVEVDGPANQAPFERIVDFGEVLDNAKGYLVKLHRNRENLIFKRRDLYEVKAEVAKQAKPAKEKVQPFDPFNL